MATICLLLTACQSALQPVEIDANDMCSFCKMAISEKRYAAEAIDTAGTVYKFDNAACMTRFVGERGLRAKMAVYYVADFDSRTFVDAQKAVFAISEAIPSPMASGLAAFKDRAKAHQFAADHQGNVIAFEDLWTLPR